MHERGATLEEVIATVETGNGFQRNSIELVSGEISPSARNGGAAHTLPSKSKSMQSMKTDGGFLSVIVKCF